MCRYTFHSCLRSLVLACLALVMAGTTGCTGLSFGEKLLIGRQSNAAGMRTVNDLAEGGVIRDPAIVEAAVEASEEVTSLLDEAQQKWIAGDTIGAEFIMSRARSALNRLIKIQMQHQAPEPALVPSGRNHNPQPALPERSTLCWRHSLPLQHLQPSSTRSSQCPSDMPRAERSPLLIGLSSINLIRLA